MAVDLSNTSFPAKAGEQIRHTNTDEVLTCILKFPTTSVVTDKILRGGFAVCMDPNSTLDNPVVAPFGDYVDQRAIGVVLNSTNASAYKDGDAVPIVINGIIAITAGGAIPAGTHVKVDGLGKATVLGTGDHALGFSMKKVASGELAMIWIGK